MKKFAHMIIIILTITALVLTYNALQAEAQLHYLDVQFLMTLYTPFIVVAGLVSSFIVEVKAA